MCGSGYAVRQPGRQSLAGPVVGGSTVGTAGHATGIKSLVAGRAPRKETTEQGSAAGARRGPVPSVGQVLPAHGADGVALGANGVALDHRHARAVGGSIVRARDISLLAGPGINIDVGLQTPEVTVVPLAVVQFVPADGTPPRPFDVAVMQRPPDHPQRDHTRQGQIQPRVRRTGPQPRPRPRADTAERLTQRCRDPRRRRGRGGVGEVLAPAERAAVAGALPRIVAAGARPFPGDAGVRHGAVGAEVRAVPVAPARDRTAAGGGIAEEALLALAVRATPLRRGRR